tara:strand:- start:7898 stop:8119 length:222 start_codon:yes stop_codon:yes gene_type:complete
MMTSPAPNAAFSNMTVPFLLVEIIHRSSPPDRVSVSHPDPDREITAHHKADAVAQSNMRRSGLTSAIAAAAAS